MSSKSKGDDAEPKRLNRTVAVSDALKGVLDSALKKRGFATRDILMHWAAMAPKPYDALTVPDQLKWPRRAGHEGATLYLRVAPGHTLAVSHEGALIAAAVNRYFGYFLVRDVKISVGEFAGKAEKKPKGDGPLRQNVQDAERAVGGVEDAGLRDALKGLGAGVLGRRAR